MVNTKVSKHVVAQRLFAINRAYVNDAVYFKQRKAHFRRPETRSENYASNILRVLGEILSALDQLHFSVELLSGFRKASAPKRMTRYDYLVFAIENFLIRFTTIHDRCLKLVNEVFELGLPDKECRSGTITRNHYVKNSKVVSCLNEINKNEEPYREDRNKVVHQMTYWDDELYRNRYIFLN
jgi:hypothetical protein